MGVAHPTGHHLAQMLKVACQQPPLPPLRPTLLQGLLSCGPALAGRLTLKRHLRLQPSRSFP